MLLGFNRGHPDFLAFKPVKKVQVQEANPVPIVKDGQPPSGQVEIIELWKCSSHVIPIFEAVGADPNKFYTASEATDVVFSYVVIIQIHN